MIRVLLALVAALALAATGLGTALWQARGREAVLQERNTQMAEAVERAESARKEADKALASLRQKNAATARGTAVKQGSLRAATVPESPGGVWAAQPVPQEVLDALADR